MQISSRADKRCNDGCQFPPHSRLPQGTMENEKTTEGERGKGRAVMRDELEEEGGEKKSYELVLRFVYSPRTEMERVGGQGLYERVMNVMYQCGTEEEMKDNCHLRS